MAISYKQGNVTWAFHQIDRPAGSHFPRVIDARHVFLVPSGSPYAWQVVRLTYSSAGIRRGEVTWEVVQSGTYTVDGTARQLFLDDVYTRTDGTTVCLFSWQGHLVAMDFNPDAATPLSNERSVAVDLATPTGNEVRTRTAKFATDTDIVHLYAYGSTTTTSANSNALGAWLFHDDGSALTAVGGHQLLATVSHAGGTGTWIKLQRAWRSATAGWLLFDLDYRSTAGTGFLGYAYLGAIQAVADLANNWGWAPVGGAEELRGGPMLPIAGKDVAQVITDIAGVRHTRHVTVSDLATVALTQGDPSSIAHDFHANDAIGSGDDLVFADGTALLLPTSTVNGYESSGFIDMKLDVDPALVRLSEPTAVHQGQADGGWIDAAYTLDDGLALCTTYDQAWTDGWGLLTRTVVIPQPVLNARSRSRALRFH